MPITTSQRLPYLDYARVFVVYLVIFGHLLPEDNHIPRDYIYSFHMPFFFLVSGMLHKLTGRVEWRKYLRTLGVPLLFFNVLFFFVVNPLFYRYGVYSEPKVISYGDLLVLGLSKLWDALFFDGNIPSGVTWFLVALLWCKFMMDLLQRNKLVWGGIFAVLYLVIIGFHIPIFYIRNGLMAFPFYYLGCTYKVQIGNFVHKRSSLIWMFLFLVFWLVMTHLNGNPSMRYVSYGRLPHGLCFPAFYAIAISGSMFFLTLSTLFKQSKIVLFLANSLITVVGIQAVFCDPYREWCEPLRYDRMIPFAFVIFFLCAGIHWLIMKYFPVLLGKTK